MATGSVTRHAPTEFRDDTDGAIATLEEELGSDALQDPTDILTWVTFPRALKVGEVAPLEVTIENPRAEGAFRLSSIDLGDGFLDEFEVTGFDPEPRHQDHSLATLTLEYPLDIPADGKRTFVVKLPGRRRPARSSGTSTSTKALGS